MSAAEERLGNDPTSELWGEHRSRYRFANDVLGDAPQRVLDVACGSGFGLQLLASAGACPFGVDYDATALAEVRALQPDSQLLRADAAVLPLPDESVDAIVCFETIEHVLDARALVFELRRVLRAGRPLVLSTPNRAFHQFTTNPFHVREFTANELRSLVGEAFGDVRLFGQFPASTYRYVPFRMLRPTYAPGALAWKVLVRLPFGLNNRLALALSGRPLYPGETDYCFPPESTHGSHALVAVAR